MKQRKAPKRGQNRAAARSAAKRRGVAKTTASKRVTVSTGVGKRRSSNRAPVRKGRHVVMARLIRRDEDDGSFDAEFWRRVGPQGRIAAMWELVKRYWQLKGRDLRELRFDRSIAVLKRQKSAISRRRRARRRAP